MNHDTGAAAAAPSFDSLVSPYGVVNHVRRWVPPRGMGRMKIFTADIRSGRPGVGPSGRPTLGCGRALDDPARAHLVAVAEAAERYAGFDGHDDTTLALIADLDGPVLDMGRVPRCSEREYANPDCPLVPFDPSVPIRWVEGVDLHSGDRTWVPAVMARYGLQVPKVPKPGYNFWYRISTGHAVHVDRDRALLGALLEVIERDSISLLWLQKLPLPLVGDLEFSDTARYLLDWTRRHFIDAYLFDATTDLGIPTVYCLQVAPHDRFARQVVGCGTGRDLAEAAEKSLIESSTSRGVHYDKNPIPADYKDYHFLDGPRFMARPERAHAFDFLIDGVADRPRRPAPPNMPDDPADALAYVLEILAGKGMQVVAVDRTTDELADAGVTAVSVVVPDLQPMSLAPLAQYRGHPRLYTAPPAMGYRVLPEEELNPWPQPFP